jgi:hypothetical protein
MSAILDSLPIIGGITVPGGGIFAFVRYIMRQLVLRAETAEKALALSEKLEDEHRAAMFASDVRAAKFEAQAAGLIQTLQDMTEQRTRDLAEIARLRGKAE